MARCQLVLRHSGVEGVRSCLFALGSQVLFGFQFNGIFQQQFDALPSLSRAFVCAGLTLIMLAVALLIAPSMDHRIVERGQDRTLVSHVLVGGLHHQYALI